MPGLLSPPACNAIQEQTGTDSKSGATGMCVARNMRPSVPLQPLLSHQPRNCRSLIYQGYVHPCIC